MAEYINLAWPPTYRAHSYQQQQQQQPSIHGQLQQAQYQNLSQNPNINPNAGPSTRPQAQAQTQQQTSYTYTQYQPTTPSAPNATTSSTFQSTTTTTSTSAWTSPATATATAAAASASTSTPTAFRAPAHKHAHHLHSIPPREKSTRTLIIDHMLWVHGRTRFAQARAELGMTDRTGGPSSSNYTHRRRPESYAESDDEMSAGEDTQPLRARQGDPGNPHADTEDARRSRQDLALARNLRLRAEGVEKVVIGMLEGGPGGGGTASSAGAGRPGVGRTGTGNSRTTSSGSSPNRLPNGVRLRLALGTIINDLFARQAPPPPHRHTQSAAAAAASSPSTSRTSGSTPASTGEQGVAPEDDDEELPRALWTLAPASAAFVRPRRRARRKTKTKKKKKMQQKRPTQAPSSSGQREPMPSSMASSTPAYLDYSARFPPPVAGSGGDGQWHSGYQAMQQQQQQQQHAHQQYHGHGHGHSQSPPYQQYAANQQRPSSSSSSLSLHHRPSSSSSQMMTSPNAHYGQSPHPHQSQQHHQQQYPQPHPSYPQQTPPRAHSTQGQFNPSPKHKPTLPVPSSRVTRLYSVGADPDSANAPPAFRCPRHLHTGCDICVEAKAAVSAISAKGAYRDTRITSPGMPSASVPHTGTAISYTPYTYAPGAGSSYAATQGQGLNSWKMSVMPGGLVPGGGGITGWQDGSGIGSGLLRPGVRGSALRRKTVVPGYGLASSSGTGDAGAAAATSERRGAGNTKLSRLIPRFIKLSALVAAELGRESRGEEVGVGPSASGSGSGSGSAGAVSPQRQPEAGSNDRYTPPPANSRRSSDVTVTPRQGQRTTAASSPIANTTPTQSKTAQPNAPGLSSKEKDASNANALRPTKEWYMLLAGLLTRAVLEGYLTGGWRGLRAVQCLMMVGLGVSEEGVGGGDDSRKGKARRRADETAGDADDEDDEASDSDSDSSSTDFESSDSASDAHTDNERTRIGLGFRLPVAAQDDGADNEDGDEEFAELDPDELPDLVEAIRILFPSLREPNNETSGDGDEDEEGAEGGGRGEGEAGEKSGAGRMGVKDEPEVEYEEEMLERLRRFYAIPESTPDCATHMEDLAWQYPAEPVERAAVRFCEAIARWRGKPELETYKKKPGSNDSSRGGDADTGGMSIDSLVHSNPVSPTMGAAHVHQQQQGQLDSINAALGAAPPRKKRQPAIEDYFTGASGVKMRQGQSTSPEHGHRQQQQYHPTDQSDSPSWGRSGGGPNKRYRDTTDDGGRAEKRMYA